MIDAATAAYEKSTVAARVNDKDVTIADLRAAFETVCPGADWKRPFEARVPIDQLCLSYEAVGFYHGCYPDAGGFDPLTKTIKLSSAGYCG